MSLARRCLLFGGNGFLGFETLLQLIRANKDSNTVQEFTLVNRGKSWEWNKKQLLPDNIRIFRVDRDKPLTNYPEFIEHIQNEGGFHTVLDFSGYEPFAVGEAVMLLKDQKVGLYIYISTDSVYEVCDRPCGGGPSRECDAVRPHNPDRRHKLSRHDSYGNHKLDCEQILTAQRRDRGDFPYTILRLADVLGPRDSTDRLLQYMYWLKLSDALGIPVYVDEKLKSQAISLVYVTDVARLIAQMVRDDTIRQRCQDEVFNLAFTDSPDLTVIDLLRTIQAAMKLDKVTYKYSTSPDITQIYPSVDNGPIATDKACSILSWCPTALSQAVQDTVRFYMDAIETGQHTEELWDAAKSLLDDLKDMYDRHTVKSCKAMLKDWVKYRRKTAHDC